MPYADGTFTAAKQNGITEVRFPFINSPTKDNTCRQYVQSLVVLPASFEPLTALSTWPGDGTFGANANIYLVEETDPSDAGGFYSWQRIYSSIPETQNVYGSQLIVRPVMHDIKASNHWAVSFDGNDSWVFNTNARIAVSSVAALTATSVTRTGTISRTGTNPVTGNELRDLPVATITVTKTDTSTHPISTDDTPAEIQSWADNIVGNTNAVVITANRIEVRGNTSLIKRAETSTAGVEVSVDFATVGGSVVITMGNVEQDLEQAVNETETNNVLETWSVDNSARQFTTTGSHGGTVGQYMVAWKGDKIVAMSKVLTVPSGTTFSIPLKDASGKDFTADYVGFASGAQARYVGGPASVSVLHSTSFYLPGVTPGITTPLDIPLVTPKDDPVSWLGEIIAGTALVPVGGSELAVWQGLIYSKTTAYAQMSDALVTVPVGA